MSKKFQDYSDEWGNSDEHFQRARSKQLKEKKHRGSDKYNYEGYEYADVKNERSKVDNRRYK